MRKSLDQIRAAAAYRQISQAGDEDLMRLAVKLPFMLQTNGLLATWAYLLAKAKDHGSDAHSKCLRILLLHLRSEGFRFGLPSGDGQTVFLHWVGADVSDSSQLRRTTAEAIAFSVWLKRAAEAYGAGED